MTIMMCATCRQELAGHPAAGVPKHDDCTKKAGRSRARAEAESAIGAEVARLRMLAASLEKKIPSEAAALYERGDRRLPRGRVRRLLGDLERSSR